MFFLGYVLAGAGEGKLGTVTGNFSVLLESGDSDNDFYRAHFVRLGAQSQGPVRLSGLVKVLLFLLKSEEKVNMIHPGFHLSLYQHRCRIILNILYGGREGRRGPPR